MTDNRAKPLLLLDVDGPLNPYEAKPHRRPAGYDTYRLVTVWTPDQPPVQRWGVAGEHGMRVWLSAAHGPMLLAIADVFELVWATAWGDLANTLIAPAIGLPTDLPVVPLPQYVERTPGRIWKRDAVEQYANGRPFAWFDDDFEPGDLLWAAQRTAGGAPTLLHGVRPSVGITQLDVDAVAAWAS